MFPVQPLEHSYDPAKGTETVYYMGKSLGTFHRGQFVAVNRSLSNKEQMALAYWLCARNQELFDRHILANSEPTSHAEACATLSAVAEWPEILDLQA